MRLFPSPSLMLPLVLGLCSGAAFAQEGDIPAKCHPWGRFPAGAWKLVRTVTETLDEKGSVISTSTAETTTILTEIGKNGVTLEVQVTVEVAGKRFDGETQTTKEGFHGEAASPGMKVKAAAAAEVTVEGRKVPCRVQQVECLGPTAKSVTSVYFSDTVAPYVLRREGVTTDLEGNTTLNETTAEATALDMPWKFHAQLKNTAIIKTVHKHPKGTVTTWAFNSPDVPGGIVGYTSKEVDKTGRVVRRSTLELVDYGFQCEEEKVGPTGRIKRRPRLRDGSVRYGPR